MSKKKVRNFILFDQFRMVISYSSISMKNISVPVYSERGERKNKIYNSTKFLHLDKIEYIQINVPKIVLKNIDLDSYCNKKHKIKVLPPMNPSSYNDPKLYKSVVIPFKVFKYLIQEYEHYRMNYAGEIPEDKMSRIFQYLDDSLKHAKLRDKNMKTICYMTMF